MPNKKEITDNKEEIGCEKQHGSFTRKEISLETLHPAMKTRATKVTYKFPAGVHRPGGVVEDLRPDLGRLHGLRSRYLLRLPGAMKALRQVVDRGRDQRGLVLRFLRLLPVDRVQQLVPVVSRRCLQPTWLAVSELVRRRVAPWRSPSRNYGGPLRAEDRVRRFRVKRTALLGLGCLGTVALRLGTQHQAQLVPRRRHRAWAVQ